MAEQVTVAEIVQYIEDVGKGSVKINWRANQVAYTQFLAEVQLLASFTPEQWMTDEYRIRSGWPQMIIKDCLAHKASLVEATAVKTERDEMLESIRLLQEQVRALTESMAAKTEPEAAVVEPTAEVPTEDMPAKPEDAEEAPAEEA